eukprot:CAMPEP_0201480360 /NCGR_PEP_ID=MMETSP0151_2-20130828/4843_1 /ASSEMBLY_ACC=CAM_ASM_000257 /TAXON_ID=200890 /ORGANISM="Paramoeba atlantica, Strain 621/1 / CCAP 1560/9" /LENGTH=190 /DNA_ID=CAMNT_0047862175 /DNA_START=131 /DNA_END=700 /DNA_ORIENTATION=-
MKDVLPPYCVSQHVTLLLRRPARSSFSSPTLLGVFLLTLLHVLGGYDVPSPTRWTPPTRFDPSHALDDEDDVLEHDPRVGNPREDTDTPSPLTDVPVPRPPHPHQPSPPRAFPVRPVRYDTSDPAAAERARALNDVWNSPLREHPSVAGLGEETPEVVEGEWGRGPAYPSQHSHRPHPASPRTLPPPPRE